MINICKVTWFFFCDNKEGSCTLFVLGKALTVWLVDPIQIWVNWLFSIFWWMPWWCNFIIRSQSEVIDLSLLKPISFIRKPRKPKNASLTGHTVVRHLVRPVHDLSLYQLNFHSLRQERNGSVTRNSRNTRFLPFFPTRQSWIKIEWGWCEMRKYKCF